MANVPSVGKGGVVGTAADVGGGAMVAVLLSIEGTVGGGALLGGGGLLGGRGSVLKVLLPGGGGTPGTPSTANTKEIPENTLKLIRV